MEANPRKVLWWQSGIIYQVYPRSFQDTNGDGVGDLKGITSRLDYVRGLGAEALWVSPVYPSPMADFGYDISDYENIHPMFGTLEDFNELLTEVHRRDMKLILDLVPNHTSDQHPWFLQSRSSRDNPKRNWYIWKDRKEDGGLPNNWKAVFGGPAWEWDDKTQQYYYHAFLREQPDLNWRNPEVQEAMLKTMRFWLDKGVDGFRVDVMWHMIKDELFRDNPANPDYRNHMADYDQLLPVYSTDQPEVHNVVSSMRRVMDEYHERVMIGEIYLPVQKLVTYYGTETREAHLPFNFQLITLPWDAQRIAAAVDEYEAAVPHDGWPNWVLGNHDTTRIASRVGKGQAKVAAILLLTLRGTPTLYYGDEIGMEDVAIPVNEMQDPQGLNMPDKNLSRDPARSPMQWDNSAGAGFTETKPWLRISKYSQQVNVETESKNPDGHLALYKELIALRQAEPSLISGDYTAYHSDNQILAYTRGAKDQKQFLVVLNLTHRPAILRQKNGAIRGTIRISTDRSTQGKTIQGDVLLYGDEGVVMELEA